MKITIIETRRRTHQLQFRSWDERGAGMRKVFFPRARPTGDFASNQGLPSGQFDSPAEAVVPAIEMRTFLRVNRN